MNGKITIFRDVIFHEDDFSMARMLVDKKYKSCISSITTNNVCVF